ncbi:MAG: type II toxin-antitoxin system RelE/ParE family toxin [Roseobacter sp.]
MAQLVILPAARADLIDIGDFIALDNRLRAASFVAEIEAKILEVGERPGSFQKRDDLHKGLRYCQVNLRDDVIRRLWI